MRLKSAENSEIFLSLYKILCNKTIKMDDFDVKKRIFHIS